MTGTKLSDFANADLDKVVEQLSTDEAISLIAGVGFWWTAEIPRLGIPSIKVSDGPNGVRGGHFFNGTPANCIPCSSALGATWDPEIVHEIALDLLAPETKMRAASVILAPTCNIQRSPLGGRSFESFAEDPHLSGMIASAYVNGVQHGGISACIKHFVCNDQEHERMGVDSIVSDRALREVYLYPFMLAQKNAQPWCYMTAYNKVNGTHMSENPAILKNILRGEWGSDATVMSDWFGVYSVTESINASLDLEMPGVQKWREHNKVNRSVESYKTSVRTIKERAKQVLKLVKKVSATNPAVIDGDGIEKWRKNDTDSALMRKIAAASLVLLKNDNNVLPLKPESLRRVAIIGPNARARVTSGGGSASLKNAYVVTPYDGIVSALGEGVKVEYHEGCAGYRILPSLDNEITTLDGKPGWEGSFHSHDATDKPLPEPFITMPLTETNIFISDSSPKGLTERWTMKLRGKLRPREVDTQFEFGLSVAGKAKLWLDGNLIIDNWTRQRRGEFLFMTGSVEEKAQVTLQAGRAHEIYIEFNNVRGPADGDEDEVMLPGGPGVRLGGARVLDAEAAVDEAVELARDADVAIVVVGLNDDWESEGWDRKTLSLPGVTDSLVEKVGKANKNTVVVNQSGSAVAMPWIDSVSSVVQAWYGGNENGNAIADVLLGKVNPGGKLSISFPKRIEDIPSYGHFGSENGKVRYSEDLFVGYKGYQKRNITTLFPFGHGLSYTTFKLGEAQVSKPTGSGTDISLTVTVPVTNTGSVAGSEVVQVYVTLPKGHLSHPNNQLRGFKKVKDVAPGQTVEATITLDKYSVSYWDDLISRWRADKGTYILKVGTSSDNIVSEVAFEVENAFEWNGL